jgi:hypothetical protein
MPRACQPCCLHSQLGSFILPAARTNRMITYNVQALLRLTPLLFPFRVLVGFLVVVIVHVVAVVYLMLVVPHRVHWVAVGVAMIARAVSVVPRLSVRVVATPLPIVQPRPKLVVPLQ